MNRVSRSHLVAAVLGAALVAAIALGFRGSHMDDAFIGFRGVQNLAEGRGLTLNPGERVEAFTNTAWLLLLSLVPGKDIPLAGTLAGILSVCLCLLLMPWVLRTLGKEEGLVRESPVWPAIILLMALSSELVYFSISGMETGFTALVLLLFLLLANRWKGYLGVLLALLAFFLRPDTLTLLPFLFMIDLAARWTGREKSGDSSLKLTHLLVFAAGLLLLSTLRQGYYGSWLPNTFNSKPSSPVLFMVNLVKLVMGELTNLPFWMRNPGGMLLVGLGALTLFQSGNPMARRCVALFLSGLFFSVYSLRDWTMMARYMAPYLPTALLMAGFGLQSLGQLIPIQQDSRATGVGRFLKGFMIFLFMGALFFGTMMEWERNLGEKAKGKYPGFVLDCTPLMAMARSIGNDFANAGFTIACRRIGALSYCSGMEIFDYVFGLPNRDVALLVRKRGKPIDDPSDGILDEVWKKRAPALYLEDSRELEKIYAARGVMDLKGTYPQLELHGQVYSFIRSQTIAPGVEWVLFGDARALEHLKRQKRSETIFPSAPAAF